MDVVLVGGGARSGKSGFGLRYVEERFDRGVFLATAEAGDEEMAERIRRHRAERGPFWRTAEEPLDLAGALEREASGCEPILVDCLTLWLSNILLHPDLDEEAEIDRLEALLRAWRGPMLVLIANEVGCGLVPDNALGRRFRDLAGAMNQRFAQTADEVYWMIFGQPLQLKPAGGRST